MNIISASCVILNPEVFPKMLTSIETAGRVCYKSEDKIGPGTAAKFVQMLLNNGHEAMIEHGPSISVLFTVDRGVTHEEVRHRIASFAQESTRYCNYSMGKFGNSVTFIDIYTGMLYDTSMAKLSTETIIEIHDEWLQACIDAERHYLHMLDLGATAQIARSVLPNSTKADIVITANPREWRHIGKLRTAKTAHPQMREVMQPLFRQFQALVPVLFDDILF